MGLCELPAVSRSAVFSLILSLVVSSMCHPINLSFQQTVLFYKVGMGDDVSAQTMVVFEQTINIVSLVFKGML